MKQHNTNIVSYALAKLANEKGFDIPCKSFYHVEEFNRTNVTTTDKLNDPHPKKYLAPTTLELDNWLFDNKNIATEITFDDGSWLLYAGEFTFPDNSVEFRDAVICDTARDAKERKHEARERVLTEALNLL